MLRNTHLDPHQILNRHGSLRLTRVLTRRIPTLLHRLRLPQPQRVAGRFLRCHRLRRRRHRERPLRRRRRPLRLRDVGEWVGAGAPAGCDEDFVGGFSELQVGEGEAELGGEGVREVVVGGWNWKCGFIIADSHVELGREREVLGVFSSFGYAVYPKEKRESESAVGLFLLDVLRNGLTLGFAYSWNFRREMR